MTTAVIKEIIINNPKATVRTWYFGLISLHCIAQTSRWNQMFVYLWIPSSQEPVVQLTAGICGYGFPALIYVRIALAVSVRMVYKHFYFLLFLKFDNLPWLLGIVIEEQFEKKLVKTSRIKKFVWCCTFRGWIFSLGLTELFLVKNFKMSKYLFYFYFCSLCICVISNFGETLSLLSHRLLSQKSQAEFYFH